MSSLIRWFLANRVAPNLLMIALLLAGTLATPSRGLRVYVASPRSPRVVLAWSPSARSVLFGVTINQLSLFGFILALGIVVDDAIVVGESVYREQRRDAESGGERNQLAATRRAVMRVRKPIVFSALTTVVAFLPLFFLPGASGAFISDIARVVILVPSVPSALPRPPGR